ncbi:MAG: tetratricopeptide repeat protein, partial [Candidatus Bruticola sp.]
MADTIEGLMQEARTFADSRSWDQAIESYSRVLELDADNDEACRNLAQIYALRGMLKSVISTYLRLMHIYIARSDMDNAMAVANYVLLLEPESVDVRSELINMYRYRGDTAEVVARSLDLARLYTELDEGDRSIELLQNVLNDDPNNADVCRELAEMYIQYGQVERGANQYHQVADLYQANGQLEKACEALERILVVNSNDSGAIFHLGELYSMLGRWEDAEKQFRSALKFDFENLDVMFALGDVCQRKGDLDQASLAYRKIIMTAPDYVLAQERLGEVYHLQNNIELAIKAYLTAAGLYVNNSDSEHAIALYQRVIFLDPNNPTATRELTNLGAPVVGNDGGIQPLVKAKASKGAKGESRRGKKDGEHKTRSGLVPKNGGGMRVGLMAKGSATKPGMGGKPMLGGDEGEGAPRPGLMRAGLKPMGGGKPTLGGKPMLGGKRVLGSRKKKTEDVQAEPQEEHKAVSLAKEAEAAIPAEHENLENHEVEATQANEASAHLEHDSAVEATEQHDAEPIVEESTELPEHQEVAQHDSQVEDVAIDEQAQPEAAVQDVAYDDYRFEPPQAPAAPAELPHEEASATEHYDNADGGLYASTEEAVPVAEEQLGTVEPLPALEDLPVELSEPLENIYADSQVSTEHIEQLAGTEPLQDDYYSGTDEHGQFNGIADSSLDNHINDQVYNYDHETNVEGAEVTNYPENASQTYDEQGQLGGAQVHDVGSYDDPNAQVYDTQPAQFDGTENYEGTYLEYYDMRPLIMVPEGQLIVPTPILYLERTDLYEAICQAVTEAPDPSVIPWEPLKDVDEVAIEEKMAQQSAEAARAEAEAAAAAQAQAEAAHSQEDFQSVEGFDFNSGINLKGVSETGVRRKHSKSESSARSSKLMGSQSLSERMARMRAESADSEEAAEHRTISGISRHHQDKPHKKERGRSIMGGISRPINQIIEEANQNNGIATPQEAAPEMPRPELTPSRSRSSLSERIKKARQSKAAAKAQSEEMAAIKAEQNLQSAEHVSVASGEYTAVHTDEAQFAPPAGYEQLTQDQQLNDYQPEAQPVESHPEGEQLMGGYDYQPEAQPVESHPEGEQLMGGYDYQPEAQPIESHPEGDAQLTGGYDYQPEAQPVESHPEGEQLMG